ncbi:MAG: hypothetical protein ACYCV7_17315 [Acidimicrobiales bacterium]
MTVVGPYVLDADHGDDRRRFVLDDSVTAGRCRTMPDNCLRIRRSIGVSRPMNRCAPRVPIGPVGAVSGGVIWFSDMSPAPVSVYVEGGVAIDADRCLVDPDGPISAGVVVIHRLSVEQAQDASASLQG